MTTAGIIFLTLITIATFIIVFAVSAKVRRSNLGLDELDALGFIFCTIIGIMFSFIALAASLFVIFCSARLTDENYHTIYSNKINANAKFVTDDDDRAEFVGGQPIKQTSETTTGTLTLTKNGATVNRDIYTVRYLGEVEKDSVVEKIEYSKSTRETKLFDVSLMKLNGWNSLKIHLKRPASKIAQEKQNDQNRKELNSLLDKE